MTNFTAPPRNGAPGTEADPASSCAPGAAGGGAPTPTRVYIAGPMTGLPEFNFPAFADAAASLRRLGFDVVNPAELNGPGMSWQDCMRVDLAHLVTCGAVITLEGWERSRGATLEVHVARALGLVVAGLRDLLPVRAGAPA